MKPRYGKYNTKRRFICLSAGNMEILAGLVDKVAYTGNPEHKRNPGDFGLTPPSGPRRGKSLCDVAEIFERNVALQLIQEGLRRGVVSDRFLGGWPKNIWAVTSSGIPLEAQLESAEIGSYHGYPMPDSDPLAGEVIRRWGQGHG